MAKPVLIATDVIERVGHGGKEAVKAVDRMVEHFSPHVSVMTEVTLFGKCNSESQLQALLDFLSRFEILPLDQDVSRKAIELRKQPADLNISRALTAATAMRFGTSLLTVEQQAYTNVNSLDVEEYP